MKKELSSIELKYLLDEFSQLVDGKIDKIYQPGKQDLLFSFHVSGVGKKMLRITLPGMIWLTAVKPEMPVKIYGFCALLRKILASARLRKIEQIDSERILKLVFETKDEKYDILIELFGQGNIILCQNNKIIAPLSVQKWADRLVKKGEEYTLPAREHNPFNISLTNFENLIKNSKETISKTLAVGLGLGGVYATEICLRLCIKKTEKNADTAAVKKLYKTMQSLLQQEIEPVVVFDKNAVVDITPFKLEYYATKHQEDFKTYSEAIDSVLSKDIQKKDIAQVEEKFAGRLEKIEKRLEMQRKNLIDQGNKSKEFQQKGEKIYEKYQDLKTLFAEIKKMRKTMSWKDVKAKLKSVKYITSINEKNGEIVLEIK